MGVWPAMLNIYLCDDLKEHLEYYASIIKNFLLFKDWDTKLCGCFTDPFELLSVIKEKPSTGLYFLDIDLKSTINGFETAEQIRSIDPRGFIVFLTTHDEMQPLAFRYHIEAMDYILKDKPQDLKDNINHCVALAYERYQLTGSKKPDFISFHFKDQCINIPKQDIICIRISNNSHQIEVCTNDSIYYVHESLNNLESRLDNNFFRCHKSCIINLLHTLSIDKREHTITLSNSFKVPVSLRSLKPLLERYHAFLQL